MTELQKNLSFPVLLLITINSIMGTGIFFLPAIGAATAGPASLISWVVMSIIALCIAGIFAELASCFPTAGGVYEYCKQAFGAFPSFFVGWTTLIVGNITIAMLIVGAIRYLNPLLPTTMRVLFSVIFLLAFHYLAFKGMQTSAVMLIAFACITLVTIFSLLIPGLLTIDSANFVPFFTHDNVAIILAIFLVAETFFGWETATFLAEETQNPTKVIPKALLIGTALIVIIVLLFVFSSLGTLNWSILGASHTPLTDLSYKLYGAAAAPIFSILVYISIIGSVAGWVVSAPRLLMAMAKDKLFVEGLSVVHERYNTPHKAILFQFIVTAALVVVGSGSYELLLTLLVPLVLVMYTAVAVAFIVLRNKEGITRDFTLPFGKPIAVLVIIALVALVIFWSFTHPHASGLLRVLVTMLVIGLPVYWLLKATYDPQAVIGLEAVTGKLSVLLENVFIPKKFREELFKDIQIAGKHVVDFGASIGTTTLALAKKVGSGSIDACVLSKPNANILEKRLQKHSITSVKVVQDEHMINRLPPEIEAIDAVVSIGFLSFIQDTPKVLNELAEKMEEGATVLFVDYIDYFKMLPNTGLLADPKKLEQVFDTNGFAVGVEKRKGLFWNYIIVRGIRSDTTEAYI